ncbi:hypothetical protein TNCV_1735481 [Trichonephila clavipes]|nr:hypothetical protein TNCV_1735481 [Trichonephila clavipes]
MLNIIDCIHFLGEKFDYIQYDRRSHYAFSAHFLLSYATFHKEYSTPPGIFVPTEALCNPSAITVATSIITSSEIVLRSLNADLPVTLFLQTS